MFLMLQKHERNKKIKKMYAHLVEHIQQGENIRDVFESIPFFPEDIKTIVPLTTISNRSESLKHLSHHYESLHIELKQKIQSFIEPTLLLFLGIIIGLIGYLMYLPLLDFYDSIGSL
jgi:type II secretory pathway component PulF